MPSFPTLSTNPSYPLRETYEDNVIRSKFEAGYEHTRPRFTKQRRIFTIIYNLLSNADKALIDDFYKNTIKGAGSFTWTHPQAQTQHTVIFTKPPQFELVFLDYWKCEIELREL